MNAEEVNDVFMKVKELYGSLDILVNNAGVSARDSFYDYKPEEFKKVIDLNLNSVFLCAQTAAKIMKEQGGGVILNTSSMVLRNRWQGNWEKTRFASMQLHLV